MGLYNYLAQFKTKFHICSLFIFTAVYVLQQKHKAYEGYSESELRLF
jgi:hypothetical protein